MINCLFGYELFSWVERLSLKTCFYVYLFVIVHLLYRCL